MAKARKSQLAGSGSNNRELLTWALHGLEQEITVTRERLSTLETQARQLRSASRSPGRGAGADATGGAATSAPASGGKPVRKRRKLSADARRRIAEAQKRRWAKAKAQA